MPSINLLPENFIIEAYKKREKIAIYILAVFFLLSSLAVYGLVEIDRQLVAKSSETLDTDISNTRKKIDTEIKKSELLSSDYNKKDIETLLGEHAYLSRAAAFPQGLIIEDAYISDMDFSAASSVLNMSLVVKDYDSFLKQVVLFKDSFWIDTFQLGNVAKDRDSGHIQLGVELTLRKEMFSYHDQYWDLATGMLAENANRFVKIKNYAVTVKKGSKATDTIKDEDADAEEGDMSKGPQQVIVTFDGEAYDKEHFDTFDREMNSARVVETWTLERVDSPDNKPGVIGFKGTMVLNY